MRYLILLMALLAPVPVLAEAGPQEDIRQHVLLAAADMRIAQSFKHGVRAGLTGPAAADARVQALLAMDDRRLEGFFAEIVSPGLSLQEAKAARAFFASDAGKALTAAQSRDPLDPQPALDLTPAQIVAINAYMGSDAGKKLGALVSSSATWDAFNAKVSAALVPPQDTP